MKIKYQKITEFLSNLLAKYSATYSRRKHIKESMIMFAGNIDEFEIGMSIKDSDAAICKISNKTINSIEVEIGKKKPKKNANKEEIYGINCKQWFTIGDFNRRFKK